MFFVFLFFFGFCISFDCFFVYFFYIGIVIVCVNLLVQILFMPLILIKRYSKVGGTQNKSISGLQQEKGWKPLIYRGLRVETDELSKRQ